MEKNKRKTPKGPGKNEVVYHLTDINKDLVDAWKEEFADCDNVKVRHGDIFEHAPAADAVVSPANSFGFMDGGIDLFYTIHFGSQMQERLQEVIRKQYDGEILVGQAAIILTMTSEAEFKEKEAQWKGCNENQPIKFLVSAPTMRVPMNVGETVNAYLAFRAVICAVQKHNSDPSNESIRSVLCPGLGTAVGRMEPRICAQQMSEAYRAYELQEKPQLLAPQQLWDASNHQDYMVSNQAGRTLTKSPSKQSNTSPSAAKSKLKPKPDEKKSESSTWKSYAFIALWFVLSIVGLVAGFYLEVYLVSRYEKPTEDIVPDENIMAEDIIVDEL